MTDVTTVGRLQLDHPDLGHPGGADLHNHVRSAWTKLADHMDSRFFTHDALADAAFIDFNHNFKTAFNELRINLFNRNTGTGELIRIETGGSPDLADFTIAATTGSETVSIRITNNTGSPQDIAAVIVHGKGAEVINDLEDVDTVTTAPSLGQTLVWDGTNFVPGAASGGGEINYITNWNAEADATGWVTYADAAQTTPENGVDGTPNVILTAQSVVALRGAQSFKLAKDAADRQGEGFSYDFSIAEQDQSKKLKIQFDFKTNEDAGYASGDLTVYIYDVDNTQLITPVDTDIVRGSNIFQTSFNSTTSTNYRLIFHIATVNATAWDAYIDNVIIGPGMTSQGSVVGSWASFNPIINNLSTANESGKYRRVGENVEVMITADVTGAATDIITFDLPASLTIDTSKIPDVTTAGSKFSPVGSAYMVGASYESGTVVVEGTPSIQVVGPSTGAVWNASQPLVWANGNDLGVHFVVPVAEWSGKGIVPMLAEDNMSEWVDFTPTFDNDTGTPTVDFAQKRRLGSNLEMKIRISNANSNGSNYRLNLPDNLTPIADNPVSGVLFRSQITNVFEAKVAIDDIEFISGGAALGTDYTFTAETLEIDIKVPVVEYQGSQNSLVGYSLYNPEEQTGLVDQRGLKGRISGVDVDAGYLSEIIIDDSAASSSAFPVGTGVRFDACQLDLTKGIWEITFKPSILLAGATMTYCQAGISTNSGDTETGLDIFLGNKIEFAPPTGNYNQSRMVQIIVNISSDDTYYGKIRAGWSAGTPNYGAYMYARRIG